MTTRLANAKSLRAALAAALLLVTGTARAAQSQPIKIAERWSVVGVIAGGTENGRPVGIAVLRDNETKRTYTLSLGDELPTEVGYSLVAVAGKRVVVAAGSQRVTLGFAEGSTSGYGEAPVDPSASRTARFIDNYYRGLAEAPMDVFNDDDGSTAGERIEARLGLPLQRFGELKDDAARSRFDLFRESREGEGGAEGEGSGEGFVVSYDNFEEPVGEPAPGIEITE